jgi:DNA helicase II / ATP-dependent DNA helicase PcrA
MTSDDPILQNLNPQQLEAVTAPDGPVLIVAGAGSGKTRVITRRIAHLVRSRGVAPGEVFAATFTNKAADEMKRRVAALLGEVNPHQLQIATFHSLCARILRREHAAADLPSNFTICDDRDQVSAVRHVMRQLGITDKAFKPGDAQDAINQCKIRMLGPEDMGEVTSSQHEKMYAEIFTEYVKYLKANGALDFEDLILRTVEMFRGNPESLTRCQERYRHVMVDEYQDINMSQFELVHLLAGGHRNLAVVGDEDQSIYSWRGADISNLLDFQKHFPEARVVRLEQNYRSTGNILRAAGTVIARNRQRLGKNLFTDGGDGPPVFVLPARDDRTEATFVAELIGELCASCGYRHGDMAVFFRVSHLSRGIEDALRYANIQYRMVGGIRFYDRSEVKDLLSYLALIENPQNSMALLRVINSPRRGIGEKSIQAVIDHARREKISDYEALCAAPGLGIVPKAAGRQMVEFVRLLEGWRAYARSHRPGEILDLVLAETKYIAAMGDPEAMEVRSRTENIQELQSAMVQFETEHQSATLQDYLENVSLVRPDDEADDESSVSLMTLHSAKGLEFRVAFIVGMDDHVFPSPRALREAGLRAGGIEEERRLFYVGITRAREVLFLSRAASRVWYGDIVYPNPSSFLNELPRDAVELVEDPYAFDYNALNEAVQALDLHRSPDARAALPPRRHFEPALSPFAPTTAAAAAPVAIRPRGHSRFQPGTRVRHPMLGEGVIAGVSGRGVELKLLLHLDDGSMFNLLATHARLEVLSEE